MFSFNKGCRLEVKRTDEHEMKHDLYYSSWMRTNKVKEGGWQHGCGLGKRRGTGRGLGERIVCDFGEKHGHGLGQRCGLDEGCGLGCGLDGGHVPALGLHEAKEWALIAATWQQR